MKLTVRFLAIFLCLMILPSISVLFLAKTANAGVVSREVIGESAVQESKLDGGIFRSPNTSDDIVVENGILKFGYNDAKTETEAKLLPRAKINANDYADIFADFSIKITPDEIPTNGRFVVVFGLESHSSAIGSSDSLEIAIVSDGGYKCSLDYFTANNIKSNLALSTLSLINGAVTLDVRVEMNGEISVKANDVEVCTGKIDQAPEGYMAIGYVGAKCKVKVADISLIVYSYDSPENVELTDQTIEKFENGEYNANMWYSRAKFGRKSPSYLHAEEREMKNGTTNGVLRFNYVGEAHFTTKFKYSNFDLTFDLLDVRAPEYDADGNLIDTATASIEVLLGVRDYTESLGLSMSAASGRYRIRFADSVDYTKISDTVTIRQGNPLLASYNVPNDCNPCDPVLTDGRVTNIRVVSEDMMLKVWMKYEDQQWSVDPFIEYKVNGTPLGYIRIGTYGDGGDAGGSFSIDNIKLLNLDKESLKKTTTVDFETNLFEFGDDYAYVDTDDSSDLLGNRLTAGATYNKINPLVLYLSIGIVGVGIVVAMGLFIWRKRK